MKPEPLKGKRHKIVDGVLEPSKDGVLFLDTDVKKAVEFYLRYKDKPELLVEERKPFLKSMEKKDRMVFALLFAHEINAKFRAKKKYNEWLFKLAFRDVLENERECDKE